MSTILDCQLDKASPVCAALGDLDELGAAIAMVLLSEKTHNQAVILKTVQKHLQDMCSELHDKVARVHEVQLEWLVLEIRKQSYAALELFVLFGDEELGTKYNFARTVCRRAERSVCLLEKSSPGWVSDLVLEYVNKLSTLLYCMSVREFCSTTQNNG